MAYFYDPPPQGFPDRAHRHLLLHPHKPRWHDLICFLIAWSKYRRPQQEWTQLDATAEASIMNGELRKEVMAMSQDLRSPFLEWAEKHYGDLGKSQGQLHEARESLRAVLDNRFGPLPSSVNQRIDRCEDLSRLRTSLIQALRMNSLDELHL